MKVQHENMEDRVNYEAFFILFVVKIKDFYCEHNTEKEFALPHASQRQIQYVTVNRLHS
jgi:hypothetical protein